MAKRRSSTVPGSAVENVARRRTWGIREWVVTAYLLLAIVAPLLAYRRVWQVGRVVRTTRQVFSADVLNTVYHDYGGGLWRAVVAIVGLAAVLASGRDQTRAFGVHAAAVLTMMLGIFVSFSRSLLPASATLGDGWIGYAANTKTAYPSATMTFWRLGGLLAATGLLLSVLGLLAGWKTSGTRLAGLALTLICAAGFSFATIPLRLEFRAALPSLVAAGLAVAFVTRLRVAVVAFGVG